MSGEIMQEEKSTSRYRVRRETCKPILAFTPLLVFVVCCCLVTLFGYRKLIFVNEWSKFIFNKNSMITNVSPENPYRSIDAPEMTGVVDDQSGESSEKKIVYPYYGDAYANLTINNSDVKVNNAPVYWGDSDDILAKGLAQSNYSTYIGLEGRVVISGHNYTDFVGLKNVKKGDEVTLITSYGEFVYEVADTDIRNMTDTEYLYYDPTAKEVKNDLILYTCWNNGRLGMSDERLYVICELKSKKFN